ncbi:MAG: rhodanese-like domain-containing protein [Firmicutes bacterium]|uniref:Rhodanese-related sulfurtransferase n=1 Tax=Melghirimyces thermohalophilus TaxID=1236220 RepID=A0A1G6HQ69_9BACL|nr:rhodanese-like domain-containing protein [Melghirimyces thermohalophilus]MDA8353812.1 rhodanese-like domain-containing protein [Bacillota bacterium]SDB96341.1 Rhodanese-related sulfurtransferase [Melghirimyces thermohalophilus]
MEEKRYKDIEAHKLSEADENERNRYVLVDVRRDEEYEAGHIPGARHIPHDQMESRAGELEPYKDQDILLICRSGRRSVFAANVLADRGFQRLYNLKGGMLEWTGPMEK